MRAPDGAKRRSGAACGADEKRLKKRLTAGLASVKCRFNGNENGSAATMNDFAAAALFLLIAVPFACGVARRVCRYFNI